MAIPTSMMLAIMLALAAFAFPTSLAQEEAVPPQGRFGIGDIESRVQAGVDKAVSLYMLEGRGAFDTITGTTPDPGEHSVFVLNSTTGEVVADSGYPHLLGTTSSSIFTADRSYDEIISDLQDGEGTWVTNPFTNPATHTKQLERIWMSLHDGFIFASGYFIPDSQVHTVVDDALGWYLDYGPAAFERITPEKSTYTDALYPFVLNATTWQTVAHGAFPHFVDKCCSDAIRNTSDKPFEEISADLLEHGHTWVEYIFTNPATLTDQVKRVWLYQYDGYIFGSGYYLPDSRAQSLMDEVIATYKSSGRDSAFAKAITASEDANSIFVAAIDDATQRIVLDSGDPDRVGDYWFAHAPTDRSPAAILVEVLRDGSTWANNLVENPETDTEQVRRTWIYAHDGLTFNSGYFIPDSEAQSVVDHTVLIYETDGNFDRITPSEPVVTDVTYPFVLNATDYSTVAHGVDPDFVGECCSDAIRNTGDRLFEDVISEMYENRGAWVTYEFRNPDTDTVQLKRTWLFPLDGYIFASGYYVLDAHVQAIVAHNIVAYENSGDVNELRTPRLEESHLYYFIIDRESMEVVAHGGDPDKVGSDSLSLTNADRPTADILAELENERGTWSEYTTTNPRTGIEEHKRSWLTLHDDGYIFGAGYYDSDALG